MLVRESFLWFMIIGAVIFPIIGYNMAKVRTIGPVKGAILGFLLGFAGILIILLYPTLEENKVRFFSAADEIEKFKRLLDEGAITQAEYELKKAQLLNL